MKTLSSNLFMWKMDEKSRKKTVLSTVVAKLISIMTSLCLIKLFDFFHLNVTVAACLPYLDN